MDSNNCLKYVEPKNVLINPQLHCIFCSNKKHSSHLCKKYDNNELFYYQVIRERRCKNCFRQFHRADSCFDDSFCVIQSCNRQDKHSPSVCRKRFPRQNCRKDVEKHSSKGMLTHCQGSQEELNDSSSAPPSKEDLNVFYTHCSQATQASEAKVMQCSQSTQTDDAEVRYLSQETQTGDGLCSRIGFTPVRFHPSDEFQLSFTSQFSDIFTLEYYQQKLMNYLKIPCSIFCPCRMNKSVPAHSEIPVSSCSKDYFIQILL